ncbi:MAG: hypothetical protein ABIR47_13020 [Candidatus Kapaibacterium sp.]
MLKIRHEQNAVLEEAARLKFEDETVAHLTEFFPEQCAALGEDGTRDAIRLGVSRGMLHGITFEQDLRIYIRLMFIFGREFDTDGQIPWAGMILNDPALPLSGQKIRQLYLTAIDYLKHLAEQEENGDKG